MTSKRVARERKKWSGRSGFARGRCWYAADEMLILITFRDSDRAAVPERRPPVRPLPAPTFCTRCESLFVYINKSGPLTPCTMCRYTLGQLAARIETQISVSRWARRQDELHAITLQLAHLFLVCEGDEDFSNLVGGLCYIVFSAEGLVASKKASSQFCARAR